MFLPVHAMADIFDRARRDKASVLPQRRDVAILILVTCRSSRNHCVVSPCLSRYVRTCEARQCRQRDASTWIQSFRNFVSKLRRATPSTVTWLRRDMGNIVHCENSGLRRARYAECEIVPLRDCRHGHANCETLKAFQKETPFSLQRSGQMKARRRNISFTER